MGGNLTPFASPSAVKINLEEGVKFAQDICRGMAYLHSLEPLIPRFDLNPYNIMVRVWSCDGVRMGVL